jgi:hypothetical protein
MRDRLGLDNGSAAVLFRGQPAGRLAASIAISIEATAQVSVAKISIRSAMGHRPASSTN